MPRALSDRMVRAAMAQQTGEALVCLLTLAHDSFAAPIRVTDAGQNLTSRGLEFQQFPFFPSFPRDTEDAPPRVKLTVCGVSREIVRALREIPSGLVRVTIEVVLLDTPDVVEYGPLEFDLAEVRYDAFTIEGTLAFENILNEPFPGDAMTPGRFPALFTL